MRKRKLFNHFVALTLIPSLPVYSQNSISQIEIRVAHTDPQNKWILPSTYDQVMQMLVDLESGVLESSYSVIELEKLNNYLANLAKAGMLPGQAERNMLLEESIYDLMYGEDNLFELTLDNISENIISFAILQDGLNEYFLQHAKSTKAWRKTKEFAKKYKKELIVGAAITLAVVSIVVIAIASASSERTQTNEESMADAENTSSESDKPSESSSYASNISESPSHFHSVIEEEITDVKKYLVEEGFVQTSDTGVHFPLEETGRVIGSAFAHNSLNHIQGLLAHPEISEEIQDLALQYNILLCPDATNNTGAVNHHEIDKRFSSNGAPLFSNPKQETNFDSLAYQIRGEVARSSGYYDQAIHDFSKVIEKKPQDPMPYLERSISYFDKGEYDRALEDFHQYTIHMDNGPEKTEFCVKEFAMGFARGLTDGVYDSGKGTLAFLSDFVVHPIHTAKQEYEALSTLVKLAQEDEWELIGEALSPEIHQLILEWEILPSEKRGELAGYAFGKHGADIFTPVAIAKVASKSAKIAQELETICKNMQIAEKTLIIETATEIGNSVKAAEIIEANQKTISITDRLGSSAYETEQLKRAQILETNVSKQAIYYEQVRKNANLRIHDGKQGKHVIGHNNFDPNGKKSILTHSNPSALAEKYAGRGIASDCSDPRALPGKAGYKELVNCGEFVGIVVDRETNKRTATTWIKIHYGEDGIHLVPVVPPKDL